jgi:DNA mismatch endonuclease (patch repair protein)
MMSGIRGKDTKPEMLVRQFLHRSGLRFRLHSKNLPGKPDLVFPRHRAAIFIHGCFWHRHAGCKYATVPSSNIVFWQQKFARNIERDADAVSRLIAANWKVIVIWECGLRKGDFEKTLSWLPHAVREGCVGLSVWPASSKKP